MTYQISIHNTGEVTLHSVVTTERFGLAGVTATFQEQRGITLNKSRTQAKIQGNRTWWLCEFKGKSCTSKRSERPESDESDYCSY